MKTIVSMNRRFLVNIYYKNVYFVNNQLFKTNDQLNMRSFFFKEREIGRVFFFQIHLNVNEFYF